MSDSTRRAVVNQDEPLPRCAGPRLHPFANRGSALKFVRLLSEIDSGEHSHVFEVDIDSKRYALKMFKFYDPDEHMVGVIGRDNEIVTEKIIEGHMDPFYAECRAFGRIHEHKLDGKVAVECYGFMGIPAYYEEKLAQKFGVSDWDRPDDDYYKENAERQPFRAIIKELVRGNTGITKAVVRKMSFDLKKLHKIGIYVMDIRPPNYMTGRLIDLSVAHTEPHCLFQIRSSRQVKGLKRQDLFQFDRMIQEENIDTKVRMAPNTEFCKKLRSFNRKT